MYEKTAYPFFQLKRIICASSLLCYIGNITNKPAYQKCPKHACSTANDDRHHEQLREPLKAEKAYKELVCDLSCKI
jgi:hypothetical protein